MKLLIKTKLILSFSVVIITIGIITVAVGFHLIGTGVEREVQTKVDMDLNMARVIYQQELKKIQDAVRFTALRRVVVGEALKRNDRNTLITALNQSRKESGLDMLSVIDPNGTVIVRSLNPDSAGDSQANDKIFSRVLATKQTVASTVIIPKDELIKESTALARQANIKIIPTPKAIPTERTEETDGMLLKAAAPVLDQDGTLLGVIYGGVLLNQNFEIVDTIKNTAYQAMTYKGRDIGTATIFQHDLRISTNVKNKDGTRAIGTLLSAEVNQKVLKEGETWKSQAFVVNDWYFSAYEPIRNIDNEIIGVLYVGLLTQKYTDMKTQVLWTLLGISGIGLVLALGLGLLLANPIAKRVQHLKEGTEAIADGNFDFEVHARGRDELGDLSDSFNRVRLRLKDYYEKLQDKIEVADESLRRANKELLEKQAQLIRAEKLASLGRLSAGIAHEINNPLTGVLTSAQLAFENTSDENLKSELKTIMDETIRCRGIVRRLLEFSRQTTPEKVPTDINQVLKDVIAMMERQASLHQVQIITNFNQNLPVLQIDPNQIKEVCINVMLNAFDAMPNGGTLTVGSQRGQDNFVEVRFADTGIGIPPENMDKIFDPFFTTKDLSKGTGLGLSVSLGIVQQHQGSIEAESAVGKGTTIIIKLPA